MKTFKKKYCLRLLFTTINLASSFANSSYALSNDIVYDDWITLNENNKCMANRSSILCGGFWLEETYQKPEIDDLEYNQTQITSDDTSIDINGDALFTGDVISKQGMQRSYSDKAIVYRDKDGKILRVDLSGKVKLLEPDTRIDGSFASHDIGNQQKTVSNANYRIYSSKAHGGANTLVSSANTITLDNAYYTYCSPNSATWYLKAREVILDKDSGRGEAWHAKLYIKNVPVFYTPYYNFPIDHRRKTGFLHPTIENSSKNGFTFGLPFYWNLAPNYDATITPRYYSSRGFKVNNTFRFMNHSGKTNIYLNFIPSDKGYKNFYNQMLSSPKYSATDPRTVNLKQQNFRYMWGIASRFVVDKKFLTNLKFFKIGDHNYMQDFPRDISHLPEAPSIGSTTHTNSTNQVHNLPQNNIAQFIETKYASDIGTFGLALRQNQLLHPYDGIVGEENFRKLPEISFSSKQFNPIANTFFAVNTEYSNFNRRQNFIYTTSSSILTTGQRWYISPEISYHFEESAWYSKPKIRLHHVNYTSNLSPTDLNLGKASHSRLTVPIYSIDNGMFFERDAKIFNYNILQTLEPRAMFLYAPNKQQSLLPIYDSSLASFDYNAVFRDNRYTGFDRVGDAKQLGIGISSGFFDYTGIEKARVGLGRIHYFRHIDNKANELKDNSRTSPLVIFAKYNIKPGLNLDINILRKPLRQTQSSTFTGSYISQKNTNNLINLSYIFTRSNLWDQDNSKPAHNRQIGVSGAYQIFTAINLLGGVNYDLNYRKYNKLFGGLEYHTCCNIFRLFSERIKLPANTVKDRKYDSRIYLQIVFKGLGGVGTAEQSILSSHVPGYNSDEQV